MARRLGKRKRPSRDFHTIKEQNKIDTGIFDTKTMVYLSKFFNKGVIDRLAYVIATGKEADVYLAETGKSQLVKGSKFVALKFFRVETTSFIKMSDYIIGDPRFSKTRLNRNSIVRTWCRKEFGNLKLAIDAGIRVPRPYMSNGSILAMEFIGTGKGVPAPQLKYYSGIENPSEFLDIIIDQMRALYKAGLVHADLSEYNVLVHEGNPYFIDLGQAVVVKHPNAMLFLERDVANVLSYFAKNYSIKRDRKKTMDRIIR